MTFQEFFGQDGLRIVAAPKRWLAWCVWVLLLGDLLLSRNAYDAAMDGMFATGEICVTLRDLSALGAVGAAP